MSLQVWLPLNNHLNNQGCNNITCSAPSGITYSDGKIGKCLSASSNVSVTATISNLANMLANGTSYSFTCWVKITNNVNSGWVIKLGTNSCGLWWAKSAPRWVWNENDNGKRCANETISADTEWHHLAIVVDKTVTNQITTRQYVDGAPASGYETFTWDCTGQSQPAGDTITISPYVAMLNDFRLYDHALSAKEIKEISKALICHYPLDGNGKGGDNLLSNTNTNSTNYFGFSEQTGGSTKTIEYDGGVPCVKVTRNDTAHSGWSYMWYSALRRTDIKTSTTYTLSFDAIASGSGNIGFSGFMKGNATGNLSQATEIVQNTFNSTNWSHIVFRTVTKSSFDDITIDNQQVYMSCGFMNSTGVWIKVKNFKVEEGSVDTPWCPTDTDAAYTTLGYNSNIEIDTSGYKNNGTRNGDISLVSDTPRYASSTYLTDPAFITYQAPSNMYYATYSFWFKFASFTAYGAIHIQSTNPSGGDSPWFSCNTESSQLWAYFGGNSPNYTKAGSGSLAANTWYHAVYVWNNGVAQWYLNGAKLGNAVTYTGKTYISNSAPSTIGDSYTGSSWNGTPFTGNISDFRLYATALSADDIKELYQTSASVTNNGAVMCYEFDEE